MDCETETNSFKVWIIANLVRCYVFIEGVPRLELFEGKVADTLGSLEEVRVSSKLLLDSIGDSVSKV